MAKKQIETPLVQIKGKATVHAPGVEQTLQLRAAGLDYNDAGREAEVARNAELLRQAAERLMNAGGAEALRAELDRLTKELGV